MARNGKPIQEINEHGVVFSAWSEGAGLYCSWCGPQWYDGVRWLEMGFRKHVDYVHRDPYFWKWLSKTDLPE